MMPAEVDMLIKGAQWRQRKEWELMARAVAHIVSAFGVKHFTPLKFLEGGPGEVDFDYIEFETPEPAKAEDRKAFLDRLAHNAKLKFWPKLKDKYAAPPKDK